MLNKTPKTLCLNTSVPVTHISLPATSIAGSASVMGLVTASLGPDKHHRRVSTINTVWRAPHSYCCWHQAATNQIH